MKRQVDASRVQPRGSSCVWTPGRLREQRSRQTQDQRHRTLACLHAKRQPCQAATAEKVPDLGHIAQRTSQSSGLSKGSVEVSCQAIEAEHHGPELGRSQRALGRSRATKDTTRQEQGQILSELQSRPSRRLANAQRHPHARCLWGYLFVWTSAAQVDRRADHLAQRWERHGLRP